VDPKAPDKDTREANQQDAQAQAHLGLAELAASAKQYEEALKHADAALKVNPGLGNGYILRGKVQYLRKQPEAARREFQLALDIAQNMPGGSPEQSSLLQQALQGMMLVDPQTATPTPGGSATPQPATTAAGTPVPAAVNVTTPVNSTTTNSTTNTSTNPTTVNATP
jgi:tetratricopeptide (TPR) repeat protein